MNKTLLTLASAAVLFLPFCRKPEEPPTAEYWPLSAGNQWKTLEDYSWDVQDGLYAGSSQSTTTYTVEDSVQREDGVLLWPVEASTDTSAGGEGETIISRTYYQVTEDSVYIYDSDEADAEPRGVEPNHLEVGDEWEGKLVLPIIIPELEDFSTDFPAHFEVVGREQVEVPAGTFQCLKIQIDLTDPEVEEAAYQWRAEEVGIVELSADFETVYLAFSVKIQGSSQLEDTDFTTP